MRDEIRLRQEMDGLNFVCVADFIRAASAVRGQLMVYVSLRYETNGVPKITTYVKEIGNNEYQVTGKVTVRDNYGDTYTGKYDATATYDSASDDFDVDYDLGDLYKD